MGMVFGAAGCCGRGRGRGSLGCLGSLGGEDEVRMRRGKGRVTCEGCNSFLYRWGNGGGGGGGVWLGLFGKMKMGNLRGGEGMRE